MGIAQAFSEVMGLNPGQLQFKLEVENSLENGLERSV